MRCMQRGILFVKSTNGPRYAPAASSSNGAHTSDATLVEIEALFHERSLGSRMNLVRSLQALDHSADQAPPTHVSE